MCKLNLGHAGVDRRRVVGEVDGLGGDGWEVDKLCDYLLETVWNSYIWQPLGTQTTL